jgi:hypothetical protein
VKCKNKEGAKQKIILKKTAENTSEKKEQQPSGFCSLISGF